MCVAEKLFFVPEVSNIFWLDKGGYARGDIPARGLSSVFFLRVLNPPFPHFKIFLLKSSPAVISPGFILVYNHLHMQNPCNPQQTTILQEEPKNEKENCCLMLLRLSCGRNDRLLCGDGRGFRVPGRD